MLGVSAPTPIVFTPGRMPTAAKNVHDDVVTLVGIAFVYTGSLPQLRSREGGTGTVLGTSRGVCSWFDAPTAYYADRLARRSALLAEEPAHALSSSTFISANKVSSLAAWSYNHPSSFAVLPG